MKRDGFTIIELLVVVVIAAAIVAALCMFDSVRENWKRCALNLVALGHAMNVYAGEHKQLFPSSDKWCDLLLEHTDVDEERFKCPAGGEGRSHYAMNPNAEPNSPGDVVLLFETKGGWNQSGGPEILSITNHFERGCNVCFVDGHGERVKAKDIDKLKWK